MGRRGAGAGLGQREVGEWWGGAELELGGCGGAELERGGVALSDAGAEQARYEGARSGSEVLRHGG